MLRMLVSLVALLVVSPVAAQESSPLPAPLDAAAVVRLARERRDEIAAARARAVAAGERPKIVSALPDPRIAVQAGVPFGLGAYEGNITFEQEFPLSSIRGNRRRAAEAVVERWGADTRRAALDVEYQALDSFYMLAERRGTAPILDEQIAITDQLTTVARAHLGSGQGTQADALRLENETARFRMERRALDSEVRAAEAMLDAALARDPAAPIPELAWIDELSDPPPLDDIVRQALAIRPELASARADRRRALAEVDVMRSMYEPMAVVRAGPSHFMTDGYGVMAMVGITVPLWREKLGAGVREAEAMASMARSDIAAMQRMIAGSIGAARERVLAERTRLVAIQQDILPRARQVVASASASFGAGQGSMLAVLDATRDLREIRVDELMARRRLSVAWARLRRERGEL